MDTFLHYYLLSQEAIREHRQDIKKELTVGNSGENAVIYYYNTPTKVIALLENINKYQNNLLSFSQKIDNIDYTFSEIISVTSQDIGNHREELKQEAKILHNVIRYKQNIFKLPLFMLIDESFDQNTGMKLTYHQFSGFVYLYYLFSFFFSQINGSRKRGDLPNDLIKKLHLKQDFLIQFVRDIISYSENYSISERMQCEEMRYMLYCILDEFKIKSKSSPAASDADIIIKFKLFPETYNIEHLIINQSHKIKWVSQNETEYVFTNNDFCDCEQWNKPNNCWSNFIWIDKEFNKNKLGNKDIISKLILLRGSTNAAMYKYNSCII